MDLLIEHFRYGPLMMSCESHGVTNFLRRIVVRGGQARKLSICSGCRKEVYSDENVPGSYRPSKPNVPGNIFTRNPSIIYYPVKTTDNLVFAVNLDKPVSQETRTTVSELIAQRSRVAG